MVTKPKSGGKETSVGEEIREKNKKASNILIMSEATRLEMQSKLLIRCSRRCKEREGSKVYRHDLRRVKERNPDSVVLNVSLRLLVCGTS